MLAGLFAELLEEGYESLAGGAVELADKCSNGVVCSLVEGSHDVVRCADLKDFHVRGHLGDMWS